MPRDDFLAAIKEEVATRVRFGADRAAICAASIEIEEKFLQAWLDSRSIAPKFNREL
jgi:hypothetical protein